MTVTVNIRQGATYRAHVPEAGSQEVHVAIDCPACKRAAPLRVCGGGDRIVGHDTIDERAVTRCCYADIGRIVVKLETIFGLDEDEAVQSRMRVYDGVDR